MCALYTCSGRFKPAGVARDALLVRVALFMYKANLRLLMCIVMLLLHKEIYQKGFVFLGLSLQNLLTQTQFKTRESARCGGESLNTFGVVYSNTAGDRPEGPKSRD